MSKKDVVVNGKVLKKGSKKELGKQIESYLVGLSEDQLKVLASLKPKNRDEEIIFRLLNELYPVSMSAKDICKIFGKNKNIAYEWDHLLIYVVVKKNTKAFISKSLIRLIRMKQAHEIALEKLIMLKKESDERRKASGILDINLEELGIKLGEGEN